MKVDPWSDCITSRRHTLVKKLITAFTTFLAEILCSVMASGNLDDTHMMVSKYLLLDLVFGRGPMQPTITQLNGSSKT